MTILKRILIALGSFWLAGVVAIVIMSDPGSMSHIDLVTGVPMLATVCMLWGPAMFVVGLLGLMFGRGGGGSAAVGLILVVLAYLGYLGLLAGAVFPKRWQFRVACLVIEFACALIAAKGIIAFCI